MANLFSVKVSVVIPVYNGENTIVDLVHSINDELKSKVGDLEFVLVNDASRDNSHDQILELREQFPENLIYIQLYRNFGEHNAVMCGLNHVTGDCAVIIDDDFQNPPHEIINLIKVLLEEKVDVVYSHYSEKKHSVFRNLGSWFNGLVAQVVINKPKDLYLSSYKVLDKQLIDIITKYNGPFPYIDSLILRSTKLISTCLCEHNERAIGTSNYTLRKLFRLWLNMLVGSSIWLLDFSVVFGLLSVSFLSLLIPVYFFYFSIPETLSNLLIYLFIAIACIQIFIVAIIGLFLRQLVLSINNEPQYLIRSIYTPETFTNSKVGD